MRERIGYRLSVIVFSVDIVVTLLCLYAASHVRQRVDLGMELADSATRLPWFIYLAVALLWSALLVIVGPHRGLLTRGLIEVMGRLVVTVSFASLAFAGLLYLSLRDISRLQFLYFAFFNLCALVLVHLAIRAYGRLHGPTLARRRVLVVGDPATAERLIEAFAHPQWSGLSVVGYTSDSFDAPSTATRLGSIDETPRLVEVEQIDEVIFALAQQHERVARLSLALVDKPVMVHMIPGLLDLAFARTPVEMVGGIPLISLRESALTLTQRMFKRVFDVAASAGLLLLLAPVMLLIAVAIRLESPGPIFFTQERIGESGRRFRIIKFRSMYQDAERRWREVATRDTSGHLIHKLEHDPRVTQVGRHLRHTSLDELPQLFNVLRGEMSLVGPRPEMPEVAAEYEPWQWQRFRVPPGMTGWWQVNGRSARPMHLHTQDDLYYIQNYSFWLDLRILLKTVIVVLQGDGAY